MALVIETGAGVAGANTFVDSTFADSYFGDRGVTAWTGTTPAKESALIRAGQYLNGLNWLGSRVDYTHVMCWPRYAVPVADYIASGRNAALFGEAMYGMYWPSNVVPIPVQYAQCESALRYLTGVDMMPDLDRGGYVLQQEAAVIKTVYAGHAPAGTVFTAVRALLRPFLKSSASIDMVRS
ncbi:MAG: hypothetical protein HQK81_12335 [Desulfovibrionaceae bacterium]|nr:hypothetical protein [Desulfovibrionaceae bacterium]MBF0514831.1 hypothetical protein [Desulfovibrionaceae bacterium]